MCNFFIFLLILNKSNNSVPTKYDTFYFLQPEHILRPKYSLLCLWGDSTKRSPLEGPNIQIL